MHIVRQRMRGKKSDPEFISNFIAKCTQKGILTPEEIVKAAKIEIQVIDDKIKEAEALKLRRSKLLDVVFAFDKNKTKEEVVKFLPFFKIQYPQTCKFICDKLKNGPLPTPTTISGTSNPEFVFTIKQLLEAKIAARIGELIVRGEKFNDYLKYVLHEVE
jgi:hypothetical protein